MKAVNLYMAVGASAWIAEMEDGTLRWVRPDFRNVQATGPDAGWFRRGLTALSVSWRGASIQKNNMLLKTLNEGMGEI